MRAKLNLLAAVFLTSIVTYLSLMPLSASGPVKGGISIFTIGHIAVYFLLAFLLSLYFHDLGLEHGLALAITISFSYGLLMELLQMPLSSRFFGFTDIGYNALGAGILLLDWKRYLHRFSLGMQQWLLGLLTFAPKPEA